MPSKNSYNYYAMFMDCVKKSHPEYTEAEIKTIGRFMREMMEKSPSAQMGGDDFTDKFLCGASRHVLCPQTWCANERCRQFNRYCAHNCAVGTQPSKCSNYRAWRKQWRSYPESDVCQKCRYYKPADPALYRDAAEMNKYKCYCRAREFPEGCPKAKPISKPGKPGNERQTHG